MYPRLLFLPKSFNASHLLFKTGDAGMWYRKESPESTKSKKTSKSRDNKKATGKSGEDSKAKPTTQKSETSSKKVSNFVLFRGKKILHINHK